MKFLYEVEDRFRQAIESNEYSNSNTKKMSIQTYENGNNYVLVDTDQQVFDGIEEKDYKKIAKMYINDYLLGETELSEKEVATIDKKSSGKYTNPGKKEQNFNEKMKLSTELKNILKISQKVGNYKANKPNAKYKSWEYYKFNFLINNKSFEGLINIGIDSNDNKHFYEINKIKRTGGILGTSPNRPTGSSKNNIQQSNNDVKFKLPNKKQEVEQQNLLGKSLYVLNKKAKEYRDI